MPRGVKGTVKQIPLSRPDVGAREEQLIHQALSTPYLSQGPMLRRFEEMAAGYMGVAHAVGVSSGTAGLHMCIRALGIGPGDEVITTPFSFIASANCILYEGARPVFVDLDPQTLNMDPGRVEAKITPNTRAILPVHIFGQPCEMNEIVAIAQKYPLTIIEDACEAIGAEYLGRKAGTFGDVAVFAFYPNKQMTTGEGGVIVTSRDDLASLFRSLRNQGREGEGEELSHVRLGYNYRLDELSCALGVGQMERLEELLARREEVAGQYALALEALPEVAPPYVSPHTTRMSWFVYVVRLPTGADRTRIMRRMTERGVATRPYFPSIHLQPFYVERFGYRPGDFPIAEEVSSRALALPFYNRMTGDDVEYVVQALKESLEEA